MLVIIRGLPGSGKSTLASLFTEHLHYESDMYFMDAEGTYKYKGSDIGKAHAWCLAQASRSLREGHSVVVSNTFTQLWEMEPYLDVAKQVGVEVRVIKCIDSFGSVHDVPENTIKKMAARWEDYPGESIYTKES